MFDDLFAKLPVEPPRRVESLPGLKLRANRCLDSAEYQQILPISKKAARRTAIGLEGE